MIIEMEIISFQKLGWIRIKNGRKQKKKKDTKPKNVVILHFIYEGPDSGMTCLIDRVDVDVGPTENEFRNHEIKFNEVGTSMWLFER